MTSMATQYEIGQVRVQMWNMLVYDDIAADQKTDQYWERDRQRAEAALGFPVRYERHSREIDGRFFIDRRVIVRA